MITTMAELVGQAESSGNPHAIRFEPKYHVPQSAVAAIVKLNRCSNSTAAILGAFSWGTYQIMGINLIDLGLSTSFIDYLNLESIQLYTFNKFLRSRNVDKITLKEFLSNPEARLEFARAYNGTGWPEVYAEYLLKVFREREGHK